MAPRKPAPGTTGLTGRGAKKGFVQPQRHLLLPSSASLQRPSSPMACSYVTADIAEAEGLHTKKLSGTKFRQMLRSGAGAGRSGVGRAGGRGWHGVVLLTRNLPQHAGRLAQPLSTALALSMAQAACCSCMQSKGPLQPPAQPPRAAGEPIPEWFSFSSVIEVLREVRAALPACLPAALPADVGCPRGLAGRAWLARVLHAKCHRKRRSKAADVAAHPASLCCAAPAASAAVSSRANPLPYLHCSTQLHFIPIMLPPQLRAVSLQCYERRAIVSVQ